MPETHVQTDPYLRFVPPPIVRRFQRGDGAHSGPVTSCVSAAVMFADISGFTPLTEYLAHRGPDGAELLSRLLNGFFTELVNILSSHGGEVIDFAGDAMVVVWPVIYPGTLGDAVRLAAQAGHVAQEQLHDYPVLDDRKLSLHIGIGAGEVSDMYVGGHSDRWKFVVAGPPLHQMADAEHLSNPGTVVLSPEAWCHLEGHGVGSPLASGFVRLESIKVPANLPTEGPPTLNGGAASVLRPYISEAVLTALEAGQTEWMAELRRVTVLFINISGLDYTRPDILDRLQLAVHSVQSILFHYEASINQVLVDDKGTVVVAAVGLPPLAHEDDPVRGIKAAIAVSARFKELGLVGAIGVTTGRVFCGLVGSPTRSSYTMLGDVVNLSARLMQAATNDVLCDETTQNAARSRLRFDDLGERTVKGKADPIRVFRPRGETRLLQRARKMFGRARERKEILAAVEHLKDGTSGCILIEGAAGLGKSRLIAEVLELSRGADLTLLLGGGDAVERTTPYLAFRTILRQLFNLDALTEVVEMRDRVTVRMVAWFADRSMPEVETESAPRAVNLWGEPESETPEPSEAEYAIIRLLPLLNEMLSIDFAENEYTTALTGRTRAENTQRLLVRILQKAVVSDHLVLVVEDCHWLDSASWALLSRVSQEVRPLLIVLATRPLEKPPEEYLALVDDAHTTRLCLESLTADETLPLICERLGVETLPDPIAEFILKRSGGSPFFTEELAFALRDSGVIEIAEGQCRLARGMKNLDHVEVPDTLQGVITSRIDRLSPTHQLMLKSASVVGRLFPFKILQAIYPLESERDSLSAPMAALATTDLAQLTAPPPDEAYIFKHVITQEVAYGHLLYSHRRQLHRSVAEWYEQNVPDLEPIFPLLAHHWTKAEDEARAVDYLEKAGDQALHSGAYNEARSFMEEAIRLHSGASDMQRKGRHQRLLGEAYLGQGHIIEGRKHLEEALRLLGMPIPRSLATLIGPLLGETVRQISHRLRPSRLFKPRTEHRARLLEAVRAYERLVEIYYLAEEQLPTMYSATRGLNLAEVVGPSPELARIYATMCVAVGLIPLHKAAEKYAWKAQVVARHVKQFEVSGWVSQLIGMHALGNGQISRAEEHLTEAVGIFETLGDRRHLVQALALLAERYLYQGNFDRSAAVYLKLMEVTYQTEELEARHWGLTGRANNLALMSRNPTEMWTLYDEALELMKSDDLGALETILCHGELSLVCLLGGDPDRARHHLDRVTSPIVDKPPTAMSSYEGRAEACEASVKLWEMKPSPEIRKIALKLCTALETFAKVFPVASARARTWRGLAWWLQGNHSKAFASWHRGLAFAERRDMHYDQALAHREIGRHLPDKNPDRMAHLERADELFLRCNALAYVDPERSPAG